MTKVSTGKTLLLLAVFALCCIRASAPNPVGRGMAARVSYRDAFGLVPFTGRATVGRNNAIN